MLRAFFLFLARQEKFKDFALRLKIFRNTASRFVAGENLDHAMTAVRQANKLGLAGTLDLLGEDTLTRADALTAADDIIRLLGRIDEEKVNCNVSVKLTQLGLALDTELARENLLRIAEDASGKGNFVRVDMEDSRHTQKTLDLVTCAHEHFGNVGAVLQSCLRRSEHDAGELLKKKIRVRLVKGAYLEPESVAYSKKKDTDASFVRIMKMLLAGDTYNAIATHDEAMIRATREFAREQRISKERFEFQMLYGIRRDLQLRLAQEGYRVRIYIPYGLRWYPYFMRRLAERPANVLFILRNLFRDR